MAICAPQSYCFFMRGLAHSVLLLLTEVTLGICIISLANQYVCNLLPVKTFALKFLHACTSRVELCLHYGFDVSMIRGTSTLAAC